MAQYDKNKTAEKKGPDFIKDKRVLVAGLGASGINVIKKLAAKAGHIKAIDSNTGFELPENIKKLLKRKKSCSFELILDENITAKKDILDSVDIIVLSPGISDEVPLIKEADRIGITVWSEIELAWQLMGRAQKKNTIAITGTNGKTTTVTLINSIFEKSKRDSIVCGNIGNPLIGTIDDKRKNLIRVIEISSFQLERCYSFSPFVSAILNITVDHLDRHFSMKKYAYIKFGIFNNAGPGSWVILNYDDEWINRILAESGFLFLNKAKKTGYCLDKASKCDIFFENGFINYSIEGIAGKIDISKAYLRGKHNISNIMCAVAAAKIFNINDRELKSAINSFNPLEHRQEFVGIINGIKVYNDSKATNPDATIKALESFEREVTLILGGKDKDMDFSILLPCLDSRVLNLILIGETKIKILKMLERHGREIISLPYSIFLCSTLEEAVNKGLEVTEKEHVLMLSPACASFDMFKDYKDRGKKFKDFVLNSMEKK
ncbi:MAG: UDP-N-acetylmuramoyl-L-alanine--D-glutamate ligase [Actinobacteria bacterium]|nr:UDP-N-acetylmuramoyl-L-alanine--D-glutamate ligase [Actinomycetota bacterium]